MRRASHICWPRRRGREPRTCAVVQRTASLVGTTTTTDHGLMLPETLVRARSGRHPRATNQVARERPSERAVTTTRTTRIPGGSVQPVEHVQRLFPHSGSPAAPFGRSRAPAHRGRTRTQNHNLDRGVCCGGNPAWSATVVFFPAASPHRSLTASGRAWLSWPRRPSSQSDLAAGLLKWP